MRKEIFRSLIFLRHEMAKFFGGKEDHFGDSYGPVDEKKIVVKSGMQRN